MWLGSLPRLNRGLGSSSGEEDSWPIKRIPIFNTLVFGNRAVRKIVPIIPFLLYLSETINHNYYIKYRLKNIIGKVLEKLKNDSAQILFTSEYSKTFVYGVMLFPKPKSPHWFNIFDNSSRHFINLMSNQPDTGWGFYRRVLFTIFPFKLKIILLPKIF